MTHGDDEEIEIRNKALYNALRANWLNNPDLDVEAWQVEDYRALSEEEIFGRLSELDIHLDPQTFLAYAEGTEGPEELADSLVEEDEDDPYVHDQVLLLVFELWRRLAHDQPCLSVFCDELDYQIGLYDRDEVVNPEVLQDTVSMLESVLDENTDQGADPQEVFASIANNCAHELETFLYDFIADQIDAGSYQYAAELLDSFEEYVSDSRWFDFLRARLTAHSDPTEAHDMLVDLIEEATAPEDLELNLEILSFLVQIGQRQIFAALADRVRQMLSSEEDAQDLIALCAEFCQRLDDEERERLFQRILAERQQRDPEAFVTPEDPDLRAIPRLLGVSHPSLDKLKDETA